MKVFAITCLCLGVVLSAWGLAGARADENKDPAKQPPPAKNDTAAPAAPKPDPVSFGKPVSAWVKGLKDPDPGRRVQALFAIGRAGPMAGGSAPEILKALKDEKDPSVRMALQWVLTQLNTAPQPGAR